MSTFYRQHYLHILHDIVSELTNAEDRVPLENGDRDECATEPHDVQSVIVKNKELNKMSYSIVDIFKSKRLLITSLIIWFTW